MLSPTAGPISSRTSPSERKWLPRTSRRPTRRRSLAKTRCHAVHAPTAATSATATTCRARSERVARPRRRGRTRVRRRGRRKGDSSTDGSREESSRAPRAAVPPAAPSASLAPPPQQLLPRPGHAARAEREDHVALARLGGEPLGGRLEVPAHATRRWPRSAIARASASAVTPGTASSEAG